MAESNCVACGNTTFETVVTTTIGSKSKVCFVQCAKCGGVVGVEDIKNLGACLDRLAVAVKKIAANLGVSVDLPVD